MRPVPGQGMMCFKCGQNHKAAECDFTGKCHHCNMTGHMSRVCKSNPDYIIKWQVTTPSTGSSAPTNPSRGVSSVARSSYGSVQTMTNSPVPHSQYPYLSLPFSYPTPGYYWPSAALPVAYAPPQLPVPPTPQPS